MRKAFLFSPTSPYKSTPTAAAGGQDEFMSLLQGGRAPAPLSPEELLQNVYVMARCVDLRAGVLSGLPRQLEDLQTGEIVATGNFDTPPVGNDGRPLLEDELPFELELSDLLYRTGMALSVYGYAYSLIQRNRLKPLGMRWLDPKMVTPQYDPLPPRRLTHFEYDNNPLAVDDVCYVWQPGLRELEPGPAPLQAGATAAGLVLNADRFVERFFANGAMPVTLVMAEDEPGEEEKGRIKAYLANAMRGLLNAFNIEVLGTNLKVEQLSPRLRDLDLSPISDRKEKAVCVAMGVPISIVFSGGGGGFAASSENDAIHFYEKTTMPSARLVERRLNKQFFNPLGLRLRFRPDLLEVFQQREAAKVGTAVALFDKGAIDLDELRAAAGYDPRPVVEASKVEVPQSRGGGAEEPGSGGDEAAPSLPAEGDAGEEMTKGVVVPKMGMIDPLLLKGAPQINGSLPKEATGTGVPKMGTAVTPLAIPMWGGVSPASTGPDGEALTAELGKWRRKLVKAWGRDEALPAVPFDSDILTPHQVAAVRFALRTVTNPDQIGWALDTAVKVRREDNSALQSAEAQAIRDIMAAFEEQYAAVQEVDGGASVDIIVGKMVQAAQSRTGLLREAVFALVYQSAEAGIANAVASIPPELGISVDWGLLSQEAYDFAQSYSFNLVTDLNATTEKGLREAMVRWVRDGGTIDDLADSIRPLFADEPATARIEALFKVDRARMIAETEATRAYAQGKVDAWTKSGAADFPPKEVPPKHVRCRCDIHMERQADGSWWWRWYTARDEKVCPLCAPYITQPLMNLARAKVHPV